MQLPRTDQPPLARVIVLDDLRPYSSQALVVVQQQLVICRRAPQEPDSAECYLAIDRPIISARHAQIVRTATAYLLSDLGSKNGTFVDGRRVGASEAVPLRGDHLIGLGSPRGHIRFVQSQTITNIEPDLSYDPRSASFLVGRQPLLLTYGERTLLLHLFSHANAVCGYAECAAVYSGWPDDSRYDAASDKRRLQEVVSNIRAKLHAAGASAELRAITNIGYMLETPFDEAGYGEAE
jgi:FHA domain